MTCDTTRKWLRIAMGLLSGRPRSAVRLVCGRSGAPDQGDWTIERPTRFDRAGGSMRVRCPIFGRAPLCFGRSAARRSGHVAVSSSYSPDDRADGRFRAINDANVRRARSAMKHMRVAVYFSLVRRPASDRTLIVRFGASNLSVRAHEHAHHSDRADSSARFHSTISGGACWCFGRTADP